MKRRLTSGPSIVAFLESQYSERDGREDNFIQGCFGIFGHGNVAGIGAGAGAGSGADGITCAAMSRPWCIRRQRSPRPLSGWTDAGLHDVDRTGRDEHDYRRGAGDDQPAAGFASAR